MTRSDVFPVQPQHRTSRCVKFVFDSRSIILSTERKVSCIRVGYDLQIYSPNMTISLEYGCTCDQLFNLIIQIEPIKHICLLARPYSV